MPRKVTRPRYIPASNVELGDVIRVIFAEDKGILKTVTARVSRREYVGGERVYYTAEGAEIFRWHPAHKPAKVILVEPAPQGETEIGGIPWKQFTG